MRASKPRLAQPNMNISIVGMTCGCVWPPTCLTLSRCELRKGGKSSVCMLLHRPKYQAHKLFQIAQFLETYGLTPTLIFTLACKKDILFTYLISLRDYICRKLKKTSLSASEGNPEITVKKVHWATHTHIYIYVYTYVFSCVHTYVSIFIYLNI